MSNSGQDGGEPAHWVTIASYSTGFEADMARQILEADGIPVLVNSTAPGIFGASYQGAVTGGITLKVPSPIVQRAQLLLDGGDGEPDITP